MHTGKLETSKRLQAILQLLTERGATGATTKEISERTGALNPATEVSALRHNGVNVLCEYQGRTDAGNKIYRYWVVA